MANNYVNVSTVPLQLSVAGYPYYVATLIDDNNFADAVWTNYTTANLTINLGTVQGWHDVWIGVRGHADDPSAAVWQWQRLKLDLTPPTLIITGPTNGTVGVPLIQLTGCSPEALNSLSYDLSNASGTLTGQPAMITGQYYSINTAEFTTNYFRACDVALTNGLNTITLYATDLAGNMTTLTTNIFCTGNPNPPAVALLWPQDGMLISGSSITIQGQVDDPTATVAVTCVDANGNTNLINGLTGRDGIFWIQNLPLNPFTNCVALTVSNAAGVTTTNFSLIQSSIGLTVNPAAAGDTTVYGSLDTPGYTVWVNGNQATDNGDGTWTAAITPLCIGGGLVAVAAIPNTDNGGQGNGAGAGVNPRSAQSLNTQATVPPPSGVFFYLVKNHSQTDFQPRNPMDADNAQTWHSFLDWQDDEGGTAGNFFYRNAHVWFPIEQDSVWPKSSWPQPLPDGVQTNYLWNNDPDDALPSCTIGVGVTGGPALAGEHCDTTRIYDAGGEFYFSTANARRTADSGAKLATGGPLGSTQMNLWVISATATDAATGQPVPFPQISIGGFGNLDTNGNLYVLLRDNDTNDVTPKVAGNSHYTFTPPTATPYRLTHLTRCTAAGNTNNARATIGIGEVVDFSGMPSNTIWSLSGAGSISSRNGSGTTFTAPLSPTNSTVTAQVGPTSQAVPFGVIPPTGLTPTLWYDVTNFGINGPPNNRIGAESWFNIQVLPTTVSFHYVTFRENKPGDTYTWPNGTNMYTLPDTNNVWWVDCDNTAQDDCVDGLYPISLLYANGHYNSFIEPCRVPLEYKNDSGDWVSWFPGRTNPCYYTGKTQTSKQCYNGSSTAYGGQEGPWQ